MKSDEYQELAALWSAAPAADEEAELKRLARRTPRLAQMTQWGELAAVAILASTIGLSMAFNLGPATVLVGSLILLLLAWSAWKRHHLGNIALLIDERDRVSFVRSVVHAKEAELDRSALGLALILPGTLLTMLLGFALNEGGDGDLAAFLLAVTTTPRGVVFIGLLLAALMLLSFSHLRALGELGRLKSLYEDYQAEARLDQFLGR